jgi:hypothetical protein
VPESETVGRLLSEIEQFDELSEYVIAAPPRADAEVSNVKDVTEPPSQSRNVFDGAHVTVCEARGVTADDSDDVTLV